MVVTTITGLGKNGYDGAPITLGKRGESFLPHLRGGGDHLRAVWYMRRNIPRPKLPNWVVQWTLQEEGEPPEKA